MPRTCKIDPTGGKITIKLSVTNALISGGDFKIYGFSDGIVTEQYKLQTGNTGTVEKDLVQTAAKLVDQVVSWEVSSCAPLVTNSGIVTIEIYQNGQLCPSLPTANYTLSNVPNCASGTALPLHGGLLFTK
ncbi:MAG: hypothetical protein V4450_00025 [Bacteroidota bacterium]